MRLAPRILALAALMVATLNAAQELRFENTNDQFAITLTADWKEVNATNAPYAKHLLTADEDMINRAYHLASETNFAAVIFVEIDNAVRLPESDLARLQVDVLRKTFLTAALESQGIQLLDSSYDTNRHVLRLSATCDFARDGKGRLLGAWYFTDKGSYSVSCVAPVEYFKTVSSTFTKALDTFYVDPSLAYRPRPFADWQTTSTAKTHVVKFRFGWIFGLAAVVALIGRRLFNRASSDED